MTPLDLHRLLGRCLGAPDPDLAGQLARPDFPWDGLLETANRAFLTPALCVALSHESLSSSVPEGVATYLAGLSRLNRLRNRRLDAQLAELVAALNGRGIVPLLVKGAAILRAGHDAYAASRMITDLDVLIAPDQASLALAVLAECGYRRIPGRTPPVHTLGDFARAQDVGAVDLHMLPIDDMLGRAVDHEANGLRVRLLTPTDRVLHLLLHDLVQDQGLHDGRLNLRHLHEFSLLARTMPVDWPAIRAHLAKYRLQTALDLWRLAAGEFFAAHVPLDRAPSVGARILFWRALARLRNPRLDRLNEILGNLHRSLSWYRLANRHRKLPRIRRAAEYLRMYRARTASRILHVLLDHRS
jgi:Uncharacterised nucleotidyltransferase